MGAKTGKSEQICGDIEKGRDAVEELYGSLEEAVCALGLARAFSGDAHLREMVYDIQSLLLSAGASLISGAGEGEGGEHINQVHVEKMDELIDELQGKLEIPDYYAIPGGSSSSSTLHLARAMIRRCEREASRLVLHGRYFNKHLVEFLRKLSDVVFLLALYEMADGEDIGLEDEKQARRVNIN
jgi:cob(I)alamin adenosyltransferase